MVGAVLGAAALNILSGPVLMPGAVRVLAQIIAGAFVGCSLERDDLLRLRHIFKPAAVLLGGMLIANLVVGFLIYAVSPLDLVTSLMSAVPSGVSDTPIIAADFGADAQSVAVMQFCRMVTGIGVFPSIIAAISRGEPQTQAAQTPSCDASKTDRFTCRAPATGKTLYARWAVTLLAALFCGAVGSALGFPAGAMLFSLIGVGALKLTSGRVCLPHYARAGAQMLSGAYIGSGITCREILELRTLALPIVILLSGYFINCFVVGHILHRKFSFTLREGLLAATPAGASDMALLSSDLGVQSTDLVVLQTLRMVIVIAVFPQIIHLILVLAG